MCFGNLLLGERECMAQKIKTAVRKETNMGLSQLREHTEWYTIVQSDALEAVTRISVERELWLYIRSFSEIASRGQELVRRHQETTHDVCGIWKKFRSFVRQAESYWQAARVTPYRSSPLLYYYSFLNFVKAYLVLVRPDFPNRVQHGLSFNTETTSERLGQHALSVNNGPNQIFALLYKDWFETIPPESLKVQGLLSYTQDIEVQYQEGHFGLARTHAFIERVAFHRGDRRAWIVIAFPNNAMISKYDNVFKKFFNIYEKVDLSNFMQREYHSVLGFSGGTWREYDFYQMKSNHCFENVSLFDAQAMECNLSQILKPWISPIYIPGIAQGMINLPLNENETDPKPFNDGIAIYAVMFYLSELVRYRPDLLDSLLEQDAHWLLECFVESCPLKFLHVMAHKITGKVYLLSTS